MNIDKTVLTGAMNRLKDIVPKKTPNEALQGILVSGGYLIANNMEIEAKVKLEGIEDERFLIPLSAFALINSLPLGDVEITGNDKKITIKAPGIRNNFATRPADDFPLMNEDDCQGSETFVESEVLDGMIKKIQHAIGEHASNPAMGAMCMESKDGKFSLVGLDGHQLAWSYVDGSEDVFQLLIPKTTAATVTKIGFYGKVNISYGKNAVSFKCGDCEVFSRLVNGQYFSYDKMFAMDTPITSKVKRLPLLAALNRVKACKEGDFPVRMEFKGDNVNMTLQTTTSDYHEEFLLEEWIDGELVIGFNAQLLIDALKAFEDSVLKIKLSNPKTPMLILSEDEHDRSLVLPVQMRQ